MSDFNFQTGRGLPANSPVYIMRKADQDAAIHLHRMDYISIIEPRQHGKTSLIYRLMTRFSASGYTFVFVDLSSAKSNATSTAKEWYSSLGSRILEQLLSLIPPDQLPVVPESSASWERFLFNIAKRAEAAGQKVVIVLDEIGKVHPPLATDFFTVIRSVCNYRNNYPYLEHLTFIIAGAFDPKELIQDTSVSEFNIDQRILLEDFDLHQVRQLVGHLNLPDTLAEAVTEQVYYWTSGQPYLCQMLCLSLTEQKEFISISSIDALVGEAVKKFLNHDRHYLRRFRRLSEEPDLLTYTQSIVNGNRPQFRAGLDNRHFRLANVLGLIKAGSDGRCQIRNPICLQALREMSESFNPKEIVSTQPLDTLTDIKLPVSTQPLSTLSYAEQPNSTQPPDDFRYDVFISYSHKDKHKVNNNLLRRLESEGVRICIDERNFDIGAPLYRNIEKAIEQSHKTLLFLTPNWMESEWVNFESLLVHTKDPSNKTLRLLPVIVEPCELPTFLRGFFCLDLTKPAEFERNMQRLVASLKPAPN